MYIVCAHRFHLWNVNHVPICEPNANFNGHNGTRYWCDTEHVSVIDWPPWPDSQIHGLSATESALIENIIYKQTNFHLHTGAKEIDWISNDGVANISEKSLDWRFVAI